ncbi:BTB/POZ and MATH domain-containing protein 1 [Rhynchospora pubera]|uniref:BTB/POZ and MATH domain-containing protein 1 n=1 Tax=Rhynchospora pubera TaxID=906938 RepID=A0AAV8C499_9POAL|nr:BTB/POZ and MATH domain-containing protein 1 [Rhynchospora pubera]
MDVSESVKYTKASHHFKFNYAQLKDLKVDQFVSSPVFHALGHDWVIDCFPQGLSTILLHESAWFFIRNEGDHENANPTFSCSLMNGTRTALLRNVQEASNIHPFQKKIFACFPSPNSVLKNFANEDGSFEFICSIDNTDIPPNWGSLGVPLPFNLPIQIGKLLESSETTDVTFIVENQSFSCHRSILAARSPVLKAELFGNMVEATQKHIKIEDIRPEVFKAMLHFMYTDSLRCDSETVSEEMAQHLFVAADRYAIEGLKALCEDKLCDSVSLDAVASTLALAQRHNSPRLKNHCLEFMSISEPKTLISWMLTEDYVDLMRNFPSIMAEIRGKVDNK